MGIINAGRELSEIISEMEDHASECLNIPKDEIGRDDYNRGIAYGDSDDPGRVAGFDLSIYFYQIDNEDYGVTVYFSPTGNTHIYAGAVTGEPLPADEDDAPSGGWPLEIDAHPERFTASERDARERYVQQDRARQRELYRRAGPFYYGADMVELS